MRTGFIGIGNMGGAILTGYAAAGTGDQIMICDRNPELVAQRQQEIPGLSMTDSIEDLVAASEVVVLGVKPQGMEAVLEEVAKTIRPDKVIISMAAGVSIKYMAKLLGTDAKIIRIMPNTPAMVGEGMVAICPGENIQDRDLLKAEKILGAVGRTEVVREKLIDCIIGVSGSSPAYTYMYIQALVQAAKEHGMDAQQARVFAAQSVLGAAKMVLESGESLEQLRINVCSPGGTTIEAVDTLLANGFMDDVKQGFEAAVRRSIEMTEAKGV